MKRRFLDTVRNQAKNFASTVSLQGMDAQHKVIIIDESDNTTHDVQLLLRQILRHFIRTADSSSPVTSKTESSNPPLKMFSHRVWNLQVNKNQKDPAQFFKRLVEILDQEHIEADKKVVTELINKHFLIGEFLMRSTTLCKW